MGTARAGPYAAGPPTRGPQPRAMAIDTEAAPLLSTTQVALVEDDTGMRERLARVISASAPRGLRHVLFNVLGFGGGHAALVLEDAGEGAP